MSRLVFNVFYFSNSRSFNKLLKIRCIDVVPWESASCVLLPNVGLTFFSLYPYCFYPGHFRLNLGSSSSARYCCGEKCFLFISIIIFRFHSVYSLSLSSDFMMSIFTIKKGSDIIFSPLTSALWLVHWTLIG